MNIIRIMAYLTKDSPILASLVLLLQLSVASSSEEGALRLTEGGFDYQGALQIFHRDAWGFICSKGWDFQDAEVACKQLGYPGAALSTAALGIGRLQGDVWLSDIGCRGDEKTLLGCQRSDWNEETCVQGPFVQIQCRVSSYLGCADVATESPLMTGKSYANEENLTVSTCVAKCRQDGLPLAAIQAPSTCVCGTKSEHFQDLTFEGDEHLDMCNSTCPGDRQQFCGGKDSMGIFDAIQGGCGGGLTGKNVNIVSPSFPGKYEAGYTCRWEADVSANSYTTIRLPVLDLAANDMLVITIDNKIFSLGHESSFDALLAESVLKVKVTFTSELNSAGGGGFMLTLTDDSYCPLVAITNGSLVIDEDYKYRPGDQVDVECETGFMPYRRRTRCQKNGEWSPVPQCVVFNKWTSWEFRRTILFIAVICVCVLFLMFMLTICYLLCGDTKKKNEGRYYGINTDSGEPHAPDGDATPCKEEYKAVGMEDPGMVDEEGRDASIPLATEVDV